MTRLMRVVCAAGLVATMAGFVACSSGGDSGLKEIQRLKSGDMDIVLLSEDGALNQGKDAFVVEFRRGDALVDVGTVTTSANMPMPGMTMPAGVQVDKGDAPGRYRATGDFSMAGGYQMKIDWDGPAGQGSVSFDGIVQ